ncbi:MAG: macro domain-containing protein [Deltaproteobacteria bacterium]|nr:macro domain-containing protein [Deltaproteobacteria bacterium]
MIAYERGDILASRAEALVNTVNCVGVMGRGIALQFKHAYPANFKAYVLACQRGDVTPGKMWVFETGALMPPRFIVNFPTKRHWRGLSRMEDIETGLRDLVEFVRHRGIRSIAVPPLGAGLGGLPWAEVKRRIEAAFAELRDVEVTIFEPTGAPASATMAHALVAPRMTPGRAVLVELLDRYLRGLLEPEITLLEVHKLMYFVQEAGEALRLSFVKAPRGPYAENLRHVLTAIEGHLIAGYADGGDNPDKPIRLVPRAVDDAASFLAGHLETRARFDRVAELVSGFESGYGLELLSSVHWLLVRDQVPPEALVASLHAWGPSKRVFSERQIHIASGLLRDQGWLASASNLA